MQARHAGVVVLVGIFMFPLVMGGLEYGWEFTAIFGGLFLAGFLVLWAFAAILRNDWWPFKDEET